MPGGRHARDAVQIGGRHFRIGSGERDRSVAKSSLQPRGGVKCRRRHDVSRATVNKDRRENYRVGCGEGSEGEGDLVEVRARMSSACTYIREAFASQNGDEGVTRSARGGREGARGVDLPGRDVSLTHSVSLTQTDVHHGQAGS